MNQADHRPDDALTSLLLAYDQLLAAGTPSRGTHDNPAQADASLLRDLQEGQLGLGLLEMVWPRRRPGSSSHSRVTPPASENSSVPQSGDALSQNSLAELAEHIPRRLAVPGFRILGELGRGGMGVVYKARQRKPRRLVAIKMISAGGQHDPERLARFLNEAEAVARLQHEHIVRLYKVGHWDGRPYFTLEYVAGDNLAAKLAGVPQPPRAAAELMGKLARAMHYAHQQNIIHRDLKPANILLTEDGTPKISDFGLAKCRESDAHLTRTEQVLGTPSYMAPEQTQGKPSEVGHLTDVYALGAILYEMLTGRPPFRAETPLETLEQVRVEEPVPPRQLQSKVPRDLETICLNCLRKEAWRRYPSAEALAEDLQRFLGGEPIQARQTPFREKVIKWGRRNPARAALLAVSFVALLTVLGVVLSYEGELRRALAGTIRERDRALREQQVAQEKTAEAQKAREQADHALLDTRTAQQSAGLEFASRFVQERQYDAAVRALAGVPRSRRGWEWDRLKLQVDLAPRPVELIGSHEWGIVSACGSSDDRLLVTSGVDGRVKVWDKHTPTPRDLEPVAWSEIYGCWTAAGHVRDEPDHFAQLCWIRDGAVLAGASVRGDAVVWDLRQEHRREILFHHERPLYTMAVSPDGEQLLFGDDKATVVSYSRNQGKSRSLPLKGEGAVLAAGHLSLDFWVVGQEDGTISILDREVTRTVHRQKVDGPVWDLAVQPGGRLLAAACGHPLLPTFGVDVAQGSLRQGTTYLVPTTGNQALRALHAVRFTTDGQHLFAGDDLGRLIGWENGKPEPLFVLADQGTSCLRDDRVARQPLPLHRRVAALVVAADGRTLITGGRDTAIKRWVVDQDSDVTVLPLGPQPRVRFDRDAPDLLWVGDAAGTVVLWDSRKAEKRAFVTTHGGTAITGLDVAARAGTVATCGADQTIRFWTCDGARLEENAGRRILHEHPFRDVALSPDGRRVAAYDTEDQVCLWDAETGRQLAVMPLGQGPAVAGRVTFNAEGTVLATSGPGQTFALLSADTLALLSRPGSVSGEGITAIAWHPADPARVVAGDTNGAVRSPVIPGVEFRINASPDTPKLPVAGLAFSPSGDRLAVAYENGEVRITDPIWMRGTTMLLPSRHGWASTDLQFDPTGRRLAVVHRDGRLLIWESQVTRAWSSERRSATVHTRPGRHWTESVLLRDAEAGSIRLRAPAAGLDEHDRLWVLFAKEAAAPRDPPRGRRRLVVLGHENADGFGEEILPSPELCDEGSVGSLPLSLALMVKEGEVNAVVRWPMRTTHAYGGQLMLYRRKTVGDGAPASSEPLFKELHNAGFYNHLFFDRRTGRPSALHFAYEHYSLQASRWLDGAWQYLPVGRQGDGMMLDGATGPDEDQHLVFKPQRFQGDPTPLTYVRLSGPGLEERVREILDPAWDLGRAAFIAVSPDGTPVVAYERRKTHGVYELVVARRSREAWDRRVVLDVMPSMSNLTCDADGKLYFSYLEADGRRLMLATGTGDSWDIEPVWTHVPGEDEASDELATLQPVTRIDRQRRPVVIVACESVRHGWLRVFRPTSGR